MAQDEFAPKTQVSEVPNFLQYSRGYTSGSSAIGTLFEDLGKALGVGANALDQAASMRVNEEVRASVEEADTRLGIDTRLPARGESVEALPKDAQMQLKRIEASKRAMEAGKITPTQYQVRLLADSKAIRARYPGYSDQIDAAYSRLTGSTPANAIRRSLMAAADDASRAQAESKSHARRFLDQNLANIEDPELRARAALPGAEADPAFVARARLSIADKVGRDEKIKTTTELLNLNAAQRNYDRTLSGDTYAQTLSEIDRTMVNSGPNLDKLREISNEALTARRAGLPVKPETQQQLQALVSQLDGYFNERLQNARLNARYMDQFPEERLKLEEAQLKRWDMTKKAILGGDFSHLAANTALVKSQKEFTEASMIKDSQTLLDFSTLQTMLGPQASAILAETGVREKLTDSVQERLRVTEEADIVNKRFRTLKQKMQKLRDDGADSKTAASVLDSLTTMLVAGPQDKSLSDRLIDVLYAPDSVEFLEKLPDEKSRVAAFNKLTSPKMAKRIAEESKRNPEIARKFEEFYVKGILPTMQSFIKTVNKYNQERTDVRIVYDPTRLEFVSRTNESQKGRVGARFKDLFITPSLSLFGTVDEMSARIAVTNLNNELKKFRSLSKTLDGSLITEEIKAGGMGLMRGLGFDFNASESYEGIPPLLTYLQNLPETEAYKEAQQRIKDAKKKLGEEQSAFIGKVFDSISGVIAEGVDALKKNPPIE